MNLFADTLLIAARMDTSTRPGAVSPSRRSTPLTARVRRWFASHGR